MTDNPDEVSGPARVRPFADVLQDLNHGEVASNVARMLQDLVVAVQEHGKKGTFTLRIDVAPMKGNPNAVLFSAAPTIKPPTAEPVAAAFFVDNDGNPVRDDPRQIALPLREVPKPTTTTDLREARK